MLLNMKNESTGFGSRKSGYQIRHKILNLLSAKPEIPLVVDWSGVPVISSSFGDEVMGKIFIKIGPLNFSARLRNKNMEPLVKGLLDKAISQRLSQSTSI